MADRDTTERSPEEIRREIERTRSHMDRTVEAIGDKLSPGRFVDELWIRAQSEGAAALGNTLKDHPIPFALIGAGLGWLVMEQARGKGGDGMGHVGPGTYGRAEGRVGPYRGDAVDRDDPDWEYAGAGTKVKAKMSDAGHAVKEKLADAAGSVQEGTSRLKEAAMGVGQTVADRAHAVGERAASATHAAGQRLSGAAHAVQDRATHAGEVVSERVSAAADAAQRGARRGATRAKDGFWQMLEQNPMALGAIAFSLGVAAGAGAPTTRWEDERLGRWSGPLKDEARRAVEDTAQKVKGVAQEAVGAARGELERQREELRDPVRTVIDQVVAQVKDSARDVGRAAQEAARERASSEGLTSEGMRQMAEQARQRIREPAGD